MSGDCSVSFLSDSLTMKLLTNKNLHEIYTRRGHQMFYIIKIPAMNVNKIIVLLQSVVARAGAYN